MLKERTTYPFRIDKKLWDEFMEKLKKDNDKAQRILQKAVEKYIKEA